MIKERLGIEATLETGSRGQFDVLVDGKLVSMFFTLVLVPTLFSLMLDLKSFVGKTADASS